MVDTEKTYTYDDLGKIGYSKWSRGPWTRIELNEQPWMDEETEEEAERLVVALVDGYYPPCQDSETDPGHGAGFDDCAIYVCTRDAEHQSRVAGKVGFYNEAGTLEEPRYFRLDEGHPAFADLHELAQRQALEELHG